MFQGASGVNGSVVFYSGADPGGETGFYELTNHGSSKMLDISGRSNGSRIRIF